MQYSAESLFSLDGQTALVTGATGFLGRMMVEVLLDNGADVIALGRSNRLEALRKKVSRKFGSNRLIVHRIDMYDTAALSQLLDRIVESVPRINVLINNAHELGERTGFNTSRGSLEDSSEDQWLRNLIGGVYWAVLTTQKVGSVMKTHDGGSIINVSTMYALVAPDPMLYEGTNFLNPPGYSAAKAGLLAFTRYTASFWGKYNIRTNAIVPGPFSNTESQGENRVAPNDPFLQRLSNKTCLRRIGRAPDLAGAILFLASDASSFVTGHALVVDGGWTVT